MPSRVDSQDDLGHDGEGSSQAIGCDREAATSPLMTTPSDFDALKTRLIEVKPDLPKRLRQVAAFALENPQEMALGTASSIAARAEVRPSILVRFTQVIGFGGFSDTLAVATADKRAATG
jgi:hypothetical protein